jgi:hypothetical protein
MRGASGSLFEQYNLIVTEFSERFMKRAAKSFGLQVELSTDERQSDDV